MKNIKICSAIRIFKLLVYIVLARNKKLSFKSMYYGIITPKNSIEDSEHPFLVFVVKNDYIIVI